jgi:rhodanese-related sulfurtransferase
MIDQLRIAFKEACGICLVALVIGLLYSAFEGKGLFGASAHTEGTVPTSTFLSYDEARSLFESNSALFVDARHAYDYQQGHIRNAINVPLTDFESGGSALASVARDRLVVTYCDGVECNSSVELAKKMYEAGFLHVKIFFGGWNEWVKNGQPTEH